MRSMQSRFMAALIAASILALTTWPLPADQLTAWADTDDFEIGEMEKVKRGEKNVMIRSDVKEPRLICKVKVKYADGNVDTVGDVESNRKGVCEVEFDVPDQKSAVGDAMAKLKVETKKGSDRGKASRGFHVRDRRGG